ncbi:hypothetical protein KSX25_11900 [Acinetobacter baumannii]|nr:hypothetical protein [Acinetobacter baumannii]
MVKTLQPQAEANTQIEVKKCMFGEIVGQVMWMGAGNVSGYSISSLFTWEKELTFIVD